jgi:hypothetical protein
MADPRVSVALFIISRLVAVKVEGTEKFIAAVPSPTCIFEVAPLMVQVPPIVGVRLFFIINVIPSVVKLAGELPEPSVLAPQLDKRSRFPVDLE